MSFPILLQPSLLHNHINIAQMKRNTNFKCHFHIYVIPTQKQLTAVKWGRALPFTKTVVKLRILILPFRSQLILSTSILYKQQDIKGCGMGPWLVLVSPCFRENVVATCEIGYFLCSVDNLLQKNVIVLFFGNQVSKWRLFEKSAIFDLLFTFFSHQGKVTKIPSAHISLTYIDVFCSSLLTFFALPILKKIQICQIRFLFGISHSFDSHSRHFVTINK